MKKIMLGFIISTSVFANVHECALGNLTPSELDKRVMLPWSEMTVVDSNSSQVSLEINSNYDSIPSEKITAVVDTNKNNTSEITNLVNIDKQDTREIIITKVGNKITHVSVGLSDYTCETK